MKKIFIFVLLLCVFAVPAMANTSRVTDNANLFTAVEEQGLQQRIDGIVQQYGIDVAIVTVNSIGFRSPELYAADFFDKAGYGVGYGKDGILFLISMGDRDYATVTHGKAVYVFTDYGLDQMHAHMQPLLSDGEYYDAMERYLTDAEKYMQNYRQTGTAYDYRNPVQLETPGERLQNAAPFILLAGLGIGLIVSFSLKSQLKSVRRKQNASSYVVNGSFRLTRCQDIYLYTTTTRRKIETNNGGGGGRGGSSTFRSSSGGSFGGRSGKF